MTVKLKTSLLSLSLVCLFTTACSAEDTSASEIAKPEAVEQMVEKAVEQVLPEDSVDKRYKALFDTSKEAISLSLQDNPDNFVAGTHYDVFESRKPLLGDGEKIELVEFFSYGCGHCFNAEPYMHAYAGQVADDVVFRRVPVSFNPFFEKLARGYYAAEALGASEDSHIAIFDAIHIKRKQFQSVSDIADFYAQYGVDKEQFIKAFDSFSINAQLERDKKLSQAYQITGVPTVIVNGAYKTGGVKAGNYSTWFQILDSITKLEREKKAAE